MHGMNANLSWDLGNGVNNYPVVEILRVMFNLVNDGIYSILLKDRLEYAISPVDKLLRNIHTHGYRNSIKKYLKCFQDEKPFI
jgi:uncharacterized protein YehS (DUF1456 family)